MGVICSESHDLGPTGSLQGIIRAIWGTTAPKSCLRHLKRTKSRSWAGAFPKLSLTFPQIVPPHLCNTSLVPQFALEEGRCRGVGAAAKTLRRAAGRGPGGGAKAARVPGRHPIRRKDGRKRPEGGRSGGAPPSGLRSRVLCGPARCRASRPPPSRVAGARSSTPPPSCAKQPPPKTTDGDAGRPPERETTFPGFTGYCETWKRVVIGCTVGCACPSLARCSRLVRTGYRAGDHLRSFVPPTGEDTGSSRG